MWCGRMNKSTSEGIPRNEWMLVEDLADKVLDANLSGDLVIELKYKEQMINLLDKLQTKYGELPSIYATKADYIDDIQQEVVLLKKGFDIANNLNDKKNRTLISGSLAQRYIEELRDKANGIIWINKIEDCLKEYYDKDEAEQCSELKKLLNNL